MKGTLSIESRSLKAGLEGIKRIKMFCSTKADGNMKVNGPDGEENRRKFSERFVPAGTKLTISEVVHKTKVARARDGLAGIARATDSIFTTAKNTLVAVTFADCIPLFLFDSGETIAGVVHCSYKTLLGGIIPITLRDLSRIGIQSWQLRAVTGPGICGNCYDFGPDAKVLFGGYKNCVKPSTKGRYKVNLRGIIKNQLEWLGVSGKNIHTYSECTACKNDLYFSARKEGMRPPNIKAGMAAIGIV